MYLKYIFCQCIVFMGVCMDILFINQLIHSDKVPSSKKKNWYLSYNIIYK